MSKRWCVTFFSMLLVVLILGTTCNAAKTSIIVGHKAGETNKFVMGLKAAAEAFQAKYPDISVQVAPGWTEDKFKVAVATGDAPDVQVVTEAASWGPAGFIQPLNDFLAKNNMQRKDFVPAGWDQLLWRGKVYALPIQVDPNFTLIWNKSKFAEAGLNPDVAPQTVQEFDRFYKRLTKYDSDGTPKQLGMVPWSLTGGNPNTAYTWGWLFGGEWYDYAAERSTPNNPQNIKALEYLADYYQRYNDANAVLGKNLPTGANIFAAGRTTMALYTPSNANLTIEANPSMSFGMTKMFNNPEAGVENATWIGGSSIALAAGSKNVDAAFRFIQFITSDPAGVAAFCEVGQWMPANIRVPYFRKLGSDPQWRVFTEIVVSAVKYRPAIPAYALYNDLINTWFGKVMRREAPANAAMDEVAKLIDAEMNDKYK